MASVEVQVATAPAGSIPSEEKVQDIEQAVKNIEIEPTTEKVAQEEAPPSSPAEEDPVAEETVDERPDTVEKSAEESTGTLTPSEPGVESVQLKPEETPEPKEEAVEAPKEESGAQAPAAVAAVKEKIEQASGKEEAPAAVETAAGQKSEESLANGDSPAEIPEEKTASIEESVVEEAKTPKAVPAEGKAEGEIKPQE